MYCLFNIKSYLQIDNNNFYINIYTKTIIDIKIKKK
jgi:hypothetical protein